MPEPKVSPLHGDGAPAPDVESIVAFVEQFGWPVFPLVPNSKTPAIAKEDGGSGFKDATCDTTQIRRWAAEYRTCNWGMPTGAMTGIVAIDVDTKAGRAGDETLERLQRENAALPATATVLTPSGGMHYWLRSASAATLRNSNNLVGSGIDVRAEGGYVVIPPSQINGRAYAWEASSDPAEVGFAELPPWLLKLIREGKKKPPPSDKDGKVREGGRNEALSRLAFRLRKSGLGIAAIEAALQVVNREQCDPPLDDAEVRTIAQGKAGVQGPTEVIVGPDRARLRDVFADPPKPFPFVIESILPQDVGVEPAAGGMGKTTRHLHEMAHIILGRDVWDFKVPMAGPVLIVTAEDFRALYEERIYQIALALNLSPVERRLLIDNVFIEDLVGKDARLVRADSGGNLHATDVAETIIEKYRGQGIRLVDFDPLNLLGPGERFVNDGEAATISAVRPIASELKCACRLTHHVSKAVFRDRIVDMYAGRGGASSADNARFVWVGVTHTPDDTKTYQPPPGTEQAIADRRIARIHFEKVSYVPPHVRPIWIERDGFAYRRLDDPREMTRTESTKKDLKTLVDFITADLIRGIKHTTRSLEDVETGLSRKPLRAALNEAEQTGSLVRENLPEAERRGSRTYCLKPGAVPAQ